MRSSMAQAMPELAPPSVSTRSPAPPASRQSGVAAGASRHVLTMLAPVVLGAVAGGIAARFAGFRPLVVLEVALFAGSLAAISITDLRTRRIPNRDTYLGTL